MEKVRLGKTNLYVSRIGMGGIPIQRDDIDNAYNVVRCAYINGINFFDTAKAYTVSEEYLGNAFRKLKAEFADFRKSIIIASKSMSLTYEAMMRDILDSIKKMDCDYIDLYQFHNLQPGKDFSGAKEALIEAKEKGLIRHIGVTSHNRDYLNVLINDPLFETIQYPFNIVERQGEELFRKANKLDVGVIGMKPLAGGAIDDGAIAIKYILNKDFVVVPIPGMGSVEEIIRNTKAVSESLTAKDLERIEEYQLTLDGDFCRRCGYCKPCTKGIDIPFVFLCEGYYKRYNLKEWAIERYNTIKVKASKCIECGMCESRCPYKLPIIKKIKEAVKVLEK